MPPTRWIGTKLVGEDSDTDKALHFLLDHPRRYFLYRKYVLNSFYIRRQVFPLPFSLTCNLVSRCDIVHIYASFSLFQKGALLTSTPRSFEWASFKVLNIGLPVIDALTPGTQAAAGLFQSFAVRASGFPIVPVASLSPSFQ